MLVGEKELVVDHKFARKPLLETLKLKNLNIKISPEDLNKIPKDGHFISVSNRPIGIIEEYIIALGLFSKRKDISFLNNSFLEDASSFYQNKIAPNNLLTLKKSENLSYGMAVFPVGNKSTFQNNLSSFADSKWDKTTIKVLHQHEAPIIPIYISIENKNIFKILGAIQVELLTKDLILQLIAQKGLEVKLLVGKAIPCKHYQFKNAGHFGQFLRAKLYGLGSKLKVDLFYQNFPPQDLIAPIDSDLIEHELMVISDTNKIASQGNFDLYLAKAKKIPHTIQEIGRLREEAFREIGEGTNKSIDLDEFDIHYLHLFLFDRIAKKIAGAYRIGDGDYIMNTLGKKGFYLSTLFKMKRDFNKTLLASIELGRSFVSLSYQNQRLPLYLLWCGIINYLKTHPRVKYMIGPVSISNSYSSTSKSIIVNYIKKYHWDGKLSKLIEPKSPFNPNPQDIDEEVLVACTNNKIKLLDNIIEDIDPKHTRVPVLLKKYFAQNAKIIGFNIDPNFNEALDGFILTKVQELPEANFNLYTQNKS